MSEAIALLEQWLTIVASDAEEIARLLRGKGGDRDVRKRARAVLQRAFAATAFVDEDPDNEAPLPDPTVKIPELIAAAHAVEGALVELGARDRGIRRLREVWIRTPMWQLVPIPAAVLLRDGWSDAVFARGELPLALSEERIAWAEARCNIEQPGVVRPVRETDDPAAERLLASELELLRKKGRSRFS